MLSIKTLSQYIQSSASFLKGRNYLTVMGDNKPSFNAAELKKILALAKKINPNNLPKSATNRLTIVVAPGIYTATAPKITFDTEFVDVVSLTGNRDVFIDGVNVQADNIFLRGIDTGNNDFNISNVFVNVVTENCKGGNYESDPAGGGVLPLTVAAFSDLDRVDLADGMYNVDGAKSGTLLVTNSYLDGVLDSVLQVYFDSGSAEKRRISIAELVDNNNIYPAWGAYSVQLSQESGNQIIMNPDGLFAPVTITVSIFKEGINGVTTPQILPAYSMNKTITSVQLASNCSEIDVTVNGVHYNALTLVGVIIPANTELIINDMTIVAGQSNANAILTL